MATNWIEGVPMVRCQACGWAGTGPFLSLARCRKCDGPLTRWLPNTGSLQTFTTVHRAPPQFRPPYVLGWAKVDGADVGVLGRIAITDSEDGQPLTSGTPVLLSHSKGTNGGAALIRLEVADHE